MTANVLIQVSISQTQSFRKNLTARVIKEDSISQKSETRMTASVLKQVSKMSISQKAFAKNLKQEWLLSASILKQASISQTLSFQNEPKSYYIAFFRTFK